MHHDSLFVLTEFLLGYVKQTEIVEICKVQCGILKSGVKRHIQLGSICQK